MIVALAGGVGGAKLAAGLARVLPPEDLVIAVNTGDDFEHLGLHVAPDLDTVMYTLAGIANTETGWGRANETWSFMEALEEFGQDVRVIPPPGLLVCEGPKVLPPPAVILVEDIVRADQPFHQHIDHVYYTRPVGPVAFEAPIPHGAHRWATAAELAGAFSLPAPDGTLVAVAEDVRLLGIRAIQADQE